jgi:hypothetical protein
LKRQFFQNKIDKDKTEASLQKQKKTFHKKKTNNKSEKAKVFFRKNLKHSVKKVHKIEVFLFLKDKTDKRGLKRFPGPKKVFGKGFLQTNKKAEHV